MSIESRRDFVKQIALSAAITVLPATARGVVAPNFTIKRPPAGQRKFTSAAVEETIALVQQKIADPELAWMFGNCFPNTLDTTVRIGKVNGQPDTFLITGDIDAMWLRDSACQVWPYLKLAKHDEALQRLFRGLIGRHARSILIDSYANAFFFDGQSTKKLSWTTHDVTDMHPGVAERKWEVDSLCYCIRLAHGYWRETADTTPFGDEWQRAMRSIVATFREQQRKTGHGNYRFQRPSEIPTESLMLDGYGNPTKPVGMIHSMFRPSDDACIYPFFIPANLFAVVSLRQLAEMATEWMKDVAFAQECKSLADEVEAAAVAYGRLGQSKTDTYWAYEVDGFGNQLFMDDANVPSLLGLPYLGYCSLNDPAYLRTRAKIWSDANPYFFRGKSVEGVGSPHTGLDQIWPISLLMRALTSTDDAEILQCLRWVKETHAGTGFMHESFDKNDASRFTRSWFAWANSLFGELILRLSEERPALLRAV